MYSVEFQLNKGRWFWRVGSNGCFSWHITSVVDTVCSIGTPLSILGLMVPVPVSVEITLWSGNLMRCFVRGCSHSSDLMFLIWDSCFGLPDWIVDLSGWVWNKSWWCGWCCWINANVGSPSWLWSFACGNDGVSKIISQWNIKSGWLTINSWVESLSVCIVKEIAPSHAVRKLGPLCSNAGSGLGGSKSNSLDELLIFIVLWHLRELEVDGWGSAHEKSSNGLFLHI